VAVIARRVLRKVLRAFEIAERPAAWVLLVGGVVTFVGVLTGFIFAGDAKWATLLVSADLIVSGFSAVQEAEDDEDPDEVAESEA
jgi:hypothetical protein